MLEVLLALLLSFLLCRNSSVAFRSLFINLFPGLSDQLLSTAAYAAAVLSILALTFILQIIIRDVLVSLRSIQFRAVWSSFSQSICLRTVLQLVLGVIICAFVGLFLLVGAYSLPTAPIQQHLKEYIPYQGGSYEGQYPSLSPLFSSMLDGFTDSLILLQSGDDTDDTLLNKALFAYNGELQIESGSEADPAQTIYEHYQNGVPFTKSAAYPRYWHGYLIFTKPLLSFLNFFQLRILNGLAQILLMLLVCWLFSRRGLRAYIPVYFLIYLMLMPAALVLSIQFAPCYYLIVLGTAALLLMGHSRSARYAYLLFLFLGILTAYFDFLTYPLATFGIPAAVFVLLLHDESTETILGKMLLNGISWLWGYAGMWASKWILATLLTDKNVILDAIKSIQIRSSNFESTFTGVPVVHSFAEIIGINLVNFLFTPFSLLLLALVCYTVYKVRHSTPLPWDKIQGQLLIYTAIGCLPLLWYCVLSNHSMIHYWFTNKTASILFLCVGFSCTTILELVRQQSPVQKVR